MNMGWLHCSLWLIVPSSIAGTLTSPLEQVLRPHREELVRIS